MNRPSIERLREVVAYDPAGLLRWLVVEKRGLHSGDPAGWLTPKGYVCLEIDKCSLKAHRVIWALHTGAWPTGVIDHINGDRSDNRIANLRDVASRVNQQNVRTPKADNKTGYMGVSFDRARNCYSAAITTNGKKKFLGRSTDPAALERVYLTAKREAHEGFLL